MIKEIKEMNGDQTMLRRMKDLKGFFIGARDGDTGEANDFIFDDKNYLTQIPKGEAEYGSERCDDP
jgi:hypothetical protein